MYSLVIQNLHAQVINSAQAVWFLSQSGHCETPHNKSAG